MLIVVMYYTYLFTSVFIMLNTWYKNILRDLSLDTLNITLLEYPYPI